MEIGDRRGMLNVLFGMALILAERGDFERADEILAVLQNNASGSPEMRKQINASLDPRSHRPLEYRRLPITN